MNRRSYLTAAGIAVVGIAAPTSHSVAAANHDDAYQTVHATGPVRGELEIDLEVRLVEDNEHVEYLEDDDEVRYVAAWGSSDEDGERQPSQFATSSWERWGETRCLPAAAEVAADHLADELGDGIDGVGYGITGRVPDRDRAAIVTVRDDSIDQDDLAAVTPAAVDATYVLEERTFEMTVPIYVQWRDPDDEVEEDANTGSNDEDEPDDSSGSGNGEDGGTGTDDENRSENRGSGDSEEPSTDDADSIPGFGPLVGVVGLLGSGLLFRVRTSNRRRR
ncbi:PGF-CTERM sorting domain-containing protein [Natronosalvus vescus]|uniref:PGF-CTERM sorting domain-containing protein n=1 Tax=Natronosalvus vescus TaxID=2953881 RepID=UPI002091D0BA|nr:PGF-CTERM sorting domain-containing protein [Natronosalvus vescus]